MGIGAVLSQEQNGEEHVIAYFSRTLEKPERNYCITRRELLAVVKAIEHFHVYLYDCKFAVRTDHSALQWLLRFPDGQIARWLEKLQQYDFTTQHRPGRSHQNADTLSRRPCLPTGCRPCQRQEDIDKQLGDAVHHTQHVVTSNRNSEHHHREGCAIAHLGNKSLHIAP